ncbi:MAG: AbrB/MazE/SpoVT family DNA-binding domain-containing protein [Deltaproteobacteria bacterium]|nr:MAG: AbrB/MazE/SpoVT family DNA-binding domain-containing protein [Deltaproteobacteria bacterium]
MEKAKLFQNGQSQAVRLPREYQFEGNEVYIKKIGDTVSLIPIKSSWEPLINSLDEFSDDFMSERQQPENQKRDDW